MVNVLDRLKVNEFELKSRYYAQFQTITLEEGMKPLISLTIFTNPSARAGYDTRAIFKRSLTGLNSEFSFS